MRPTKHTLFPTIDTSNVSGVVLIDDATGSILTELGPDVSRRAVVEVARDEGLDRVRIVPRDMDGTRMDQAGYDVRVPQLPPSPAVRLATPTRGTDSAVPAAGSRPTRDASADAIQVAVRAQQSAAASQLATVQEAQERATELTRHAYEQRLADERARNASLETQLERLRGEHVRDLSRLRDEHDDRLARELKRAEETAMWREQQLRQQLEDTERRYKNRIDDIENDHARGESRTVAELTAQHERQMDRIQSLTAELDQLRSKLGAVERDHEEQLRNQRAKYSDLDARYKRLRSEQAAEQQNIIEMLDRMAQTDDPETRQMMMQLFAAQHGIAVPEVDPMDGATAELFKLMSQLGTEFLATSRARRAEPERSLPGGQRSVGPAAESSGEAFATNVATELPSSPL